MSRARSVGCRESVVFSQRIVWILGCFFFERCDREWGMDIFTEQNLMDMFGGFREMDHPPWTWSRSRMRSPTKHITYHPSRGFKIILIWRFWLKNMVISFTCCLVMFKGISWDFRFCLHLFKSWFSWYLCWSRDLMPRRPIQKTTKITPKKRPKTAVTKTTEKKGNPRRGKRWSHSSGIAHVFGTFFFAANLWIFC